MVRSAILFALITVSALLGPDAVSPAHASVGCGAEYQAIGGCPNVGGSIEGDRAVLDGQLTGGGSSSGGAGSGAQSGGGAGGPAAPPAPCPEVLPGFCYGTGQGKPGDGQGSESIPPLTLRDIAAFRPQDPRQSMQPDGWMVVGLPTNFMAHTARHVVSGTLLGQPADVRFTPVAYRWRYGDGSAARLTTPGAPWGALGLSEFDATATSHVYRASGTYVITLDVEHTAEYRFAGGAWRSLAGVIVLPANDLIATAGDAVTVLVDRDCTVAPRGPGC